jgi:hypothetical protein
MFCPKQEVNAQTNLKTSITLERSEFNVPDGVDYHLAKHIAQANDRTIEDVKIIDKKIVKREIDIEYTVKYYNIPPLVFTGDTITVTGYNKGEELIKQMKEELKKKYDRIEDVKEITEAVAEQMTYDVTYQLSKKKVTTKDKPATNTASKAKEGSLNITSAYLNKGQTLQLKVNKLPKKIEEIKWESADTKIAKVSKTGKVTAVGYGTTVIDATLYAGKYYYLSCSITVYKLTGFNDAGETVSKIEVYRGEDANVGIGTQGIEYGPEPYLLPSSMIKVDISSSGGDIAKIEPETWVGDDGITYICGFIIDTYRDGVVTVKMSDKKNSYQLDFVIGTGVSRLDPVEAVKKNDFTGYEGDELKTLQTVRKFFDDNNLFSESMSAREKLEHIVDYFIKTYHVERYKAMDHGVIYWTMIEGHGVCGYYSETVSFLCDCLGIKNMDITGIGYNGQTAESHAWNKVEVDGKWYYLDAFWCAGLGNKNEYFLTEELWSDHIEGGVDDHYDDGDIPYIGSIH